MNSSRHTYIEKSHRISHKMPYAWYGRDVLPSPLSSLAAELLENLSSDSLKNEHITTSHVKKWSLLYNSLHEELESGSGMVFFPGVFASYVNDKQRLRSIFLKFCSFLGEPVAINKKGDIIREVKDVGERDSIEKPARGHLTNQALAYHSDRSDITSLVCFRPAERGGEFKVCSSASLVKKLIEKPNFLEIVCSNIPHDLRGEGYNGQEVCEHPVVSYKEVFWVRYIRKFIDATVRHGIAIRPEVKDALDYIDVVLNENGFACEIAFRPGDAILLNNHLTLHSRNAFENSDNSARCLLRVWLSSEYTRPLPESLLPIFHDVKSGVKRGGIR